MALNIGDLFVKIGANTQALTAGLTKAEAQMTAFERKQSALGKKVALGFGLAAAAVAAAAIKMSLDFEVGMARVATLIPQSTERIKELKKAVVDMSIATGKSVGDLSDGLFQVVSAFGDSADSAAILEIAARSATAGMSTTREALELLSAVTKGYGDTSVEAVQKAADLAFQTVKLGQTTFPELAASIGRVVPLAAKLGVSMEETSAIFSTLTGVTGNAAEVSTQFAGIMRAMIKPTEGMQVALKKLEIGGAEATIKQLGLVGAMTALVGTTDGSTEAVTKLFRRTEALTALFALTGGQADTFAFKMEAMMNVAGIADEAFAEMANTVDFKLKVATQKAAEALRKFGDLLLPIVGLLADASGVISNVAGAVFDLAGALLNPIGAVTGWIELDLAARNAAIAFNEQVIEALRNTHKELDKVTAKVRELAGAWDEHRGLSGEALKEDLRLLGLMRVNLGLLTKAQDEFNRIAARPRKPGGKIVDRSRLENLKALEAQVDDLSAAMDILHERRRALREEADKDKKATGDLTKATDKQTAAIDKQAEVNAAFIRKVQDVIRAEEEAAQAAKDYTADMEDLGESIDETVDSVGDLISVLPDLSKGFQGVRDSILNAFPEPADIAAIIEKITGDTLESFKEMSEKIRKENEKIAEGIRVIGDTFQLFFGDEGGAIAEGLRRFGDLVARSNVKIEELWKVHWEKVVAIGLSALAQIAGGVNTALGGALSGLSQGMQIGGALGGTPGAIIGGGIGAILGFLGGSSKASEERRRAQAAAAAIEAQKIFNALLTEYERVIQDVISGTDDWEKELETLEGTMLSAASTGFDQFVAIIDAAIEDLEASIRDAEAALEAFPDAISSMVLGLDRFRRALRDLKVETRDIRRAIIRLFDTEDASKLFKARFFLTGRPDGGGPDPGFIFQPGRPGGGGPGAGRLPGLGGRPGGPGPGAGQLPGLPPPLTGEEALKFIFEAIERAKNKRGFVLLKKERELIRGIKSPELIILVKQLIAQENAIAAQKFAIEQQKVQMSIARDSRKSLRTNLPLMRNRLERLVEFHADFGKAGFNLLHGDLIDIKNRLPIISLAAGTAAPLTRDTMAFLHKGEQVIPAGAVNTPPSIINIDVGGERLKTLVINWVEQSVYDNTLGAVPGTFEKRARL